MKTRRLSKLGLAFIAQHEGFRSKPYLCPAGVPTVGYGHAYPGRSLSEVRRLLAPHLPLSREEALGFLRTDAASAENVVNTLVTVPLAQRQFDALVSFVFNVGGTAFKRSTLLRRLNQGDYASVPAQLRRWTRGGGKVLPGLVKRRDAEARLWGKTAWDRTATEQPPPDDDAA
jgi:lysozyme